MDRDNLVTDLAGTAIIAVGLVSLAESLLQVEVLGGSLPVVQGTLISLFTVSFGAVLVTESATEAFKRLRLKFSQFFGR